MTFTIKQFREWGAIGGRLRAQRLSKARRKQIAKSAVAAREEKRRGRGRPRLTNEEKAQKLAKWSLAADMYKSGKTLAEVGAHFGVTRERVRQVLKEQGIFKLDGGSAIRSFLKTPEKVAKKKASIDRIEQRCQEKWGMSYSDYKSIADKYGANGVAGGAITRYVQQRNSAKKRGIHWDMSFAVWWRIWQDSGHYENYGIGQGKYCMARWGDTDGYTANNVKIISTVENNSDRPQKKSGLPMGVSHRRGKYVSQKMVGGHKYHVGVYETAEGAHSAYLAFVPKRKRNTKK